MQHQAKLTAAALRRAGKIMVRTLSAIWLIVVVLLSVALSIVIVATLALFLLFAKPDRPPPPSPDYSPLLHGTSLDEWAKAVTRDEIYSLPCVTPTEGTHAERFNFEKVVKSKMDYDHPVRALIGKHGYLIPWGCFLFRPIPTRFNCPDFRTNSIQFLVLASTVLDSKRITPGSTVGLETRMTSRSYALRISWVTGRIAT